MHMLEERIFMDDYFNLLIENCRTTEENIAIHTIKTYVAQLENIIFPEPKDPLVNEWIDKGWIKKNE